MGSRGLGPTKPGKINRGPRDRRSQAPKNLPGTFGKNLLVKVGCLNSTSMHNQTARHTQTSNDINRKKHNLPVYFRDINIKLIKL